MCELLGISAKRSISATALLDSFYQHSVAHPHGWGLAVFFRDGVSVEKEPERAVDSRYLRSRLSRGVECSALFAHIRYATVGRIEAPNCHPFVWDDQSGRTWTLVHNGTLFESGPTAAFVAQQEGSTDSERLLLYIVSRMNRALSASGGALEDEQRFALMDEIIQEMVPGNKLNLMVCDGAYQYIHYNCPGTLFQWQDGEKTIFATAPTLYTDWVPAERNRLLVYRQGEQVWRGTPHPWDFREEEHDMSSLYGAFAEL